MFSVSLFTVLCAIGVAVWFVENVSKRDRLRSSTEHAAELSRQHLQDWIDNRLMLIRNMGEHAGNLKHFNENAANIMSAFPDFLAINWIGPDYTIQSVLPAEPNADAIGKRISDHPDPRVSEAIQQATRSSALQGTLVDSLFLQGGPGYVTYLRVLDSDAKVSGYINSVFRLEQFEYIAQQGTRSNGHFVASLRLNDSDQSLRASKEVPHVAAPIKIPGAKLVLDVYPSPQNLNRFEFAADEVALLIYTLIAALLSWQSALWFRRGHHLREARQFSQGLAESIPQTAHVFNCDTNRFEYFNDRLESMLGDRHAQYVHEGTGFFQPIAHPSDQFLLSSVMQQIKNKPDGELLDIEFEVQHSDGSYRRLRTRNCVITRPIDGATTLVGTTEDITERTQKFEELRERVEYERLFSKLSSRFINAPMESMDEELTVALRCLAMLVGADRCFLSEFKEGTGIVARSLEWRAVGIDKHPGRSTGLDIQSMPWVSDQYADQGYFGVESVAELPPEAHAEQRYLEAIGVQSVIIVPVYVRGRICGYLGLDSIKHILRWRRTVVEQLLTAGHLFGNAIERRNSGKRLQYRIEFENLITHISTEFVNVSSDNIGEAFNEALSLLGQFANVDRAYLTVFAGQRDLPSEAYEWCNDGVDSYLDEVIKRPATEMEWASKQFFAGKVVKVENRDDLPQEAEPFKTLMEHKNMHATVAVPIAIRGRVMGYLGFDVRRAGHQWSKDTTKLLQIVGEVFISAFERARADNERLELEKQILHTQKLEGLGVLAGGIAHDFNNLLVGILGNADLALDELRSDSSAREYIARVLDASRRAADLTQQMLAYSGRGAFVLKQVDLNDVVRDTMPLIKASISKKARLRLELAENLPPIKADSTQMYQVAMNLFVNASEALGGRPGDVIIRTGVDVLIESPDGENYGEDTGSPLEYVYLEVTDTGMGMDAETRERIFDPFFSTKFTGRGLGLAALMGIVSGHHGHVTVKSDLNEGSVFRVLIPRSTSTEPAVTTENPPAVHDEPWTVEGAILVVDDEPAILDFTRIALEHHGYEVITAEGGRQAAELFQENREKIRAVVLDVTMPDMGGFETYQSLQKIDANVQVLLSSGFSEQDATSQFEPKDLVGFIQKPYTTSDLVAQLRKSISATNPTSQRKSEK